MNTEDEPPIKVDWTVDPETNCANSSPEFKRLSDEVGRIIRDSAHDLIQGNANTVGSLIMAQLAHVHSMAPAEVSVESAEVNPSGSISGHFVWKEKLYKYTATPLEN